MGLTFRLGQVPLAIFTDSSNNVGIGAAASGSYKLQVTGTTNLTDNLTMTIASGTKSIGFGGNTIAAAANALIYSDTNYLVLNSKAGSPLYLNFDNANTSSTINMFNGKFILTQPGAATFSGNVGINGGSTNFPLVVKVATNQNLRVSTETFTSVQAINDAVSAFVTLKVDGLPLLLNTQSGGNVGIGTSDPQSVLNGFSGSARGLVIENAYPMLAFSDTSSSLYKFYVGSDTAEAYIWNSADGPIRFATNGTERMRITSGGYLKASNDGTYYGSTSNYYEFISNAQDNTMFVWNKSASPNGIFINYTNTPNNTGNNFLNFYDGNVGTQRFAVRSNGGIANYSSNNIPLSDERLKKDIIQLESVWDKIKNIEIVKYKFKDQTHEDFNMGVIAQQVQKVAPELVDDEGWGTYAEDGTTYKGIWETDLNYYSIKVLQEAMAKIEILEDKVKQLENK